jgi:hypothetical protein
MYERDPKTINIAWLVAHEIRHGQSSNGVRNAGYLRMAEGESDGAEVPLAPTDLTSFAWIACSFVCCTFSGQKRVTKLDAASEHQI